MAEGLTNDAVARRLYVSPHTVNTRLRHVFAKPGVPNRVALAAVHITRSSDVFAVGRRHNRPQAVSRFRDLGARNMATYLVFHEVDDVGHWLHSPKRQEIVGPMGITGQLFTDTAKSNRVGLILDMAAHSTWVPGDPIEFRLGGRAAAIGRVLHARCHQRLSYLMQAGPGDPPVYLTRLLRPAPGGCTVRLEIDEVDHADSPQDAEDVWLPVLAALQLLVHPPDGRRERTPG
jgi:Bacterial regulatory proteins, luxR family